MISILPIADKLYTHNLWSLTVPPGVFLLKVVQIYIIAYLADHKQQTQLEEPVSNKHRDFLCNKTYRGKKSAQNMS